MATTLGPIPFRAPPASGEDFRALSQGISTLSEAAQSIYTNSVLSSANEELDASVEDVVGSLESDSLGPNSIKSESQLSAREFADQYARVRNKIRTSTGSARARAILQAKQTLNRQIQEHPAFRDELVRQFNQYISGSPEIQEAAMFDAAQAQDTYGQDYLDRIEDISYKEFTDGGLGIPEDVPIGSLEWAKLYKQQNARRAEFDSTLNEVAILKARGELNGPRALQASMELVQSQNGVVQGMVTDVTNRLNAIRAQRVEGRLVPENQEEWNNVIKPALLEEIDMFALKFGESINQIWIDTPEAIRDTTSYNAAQAAINAAQQDILTIRDAIANDNFDIREALEYHSYARGKRIIDKVPLFRGFTDVMQVEGGLFTAMREAGLTNDLKGFQVETEEARANAGRQLFNAMMGTSGDGATDTTESPEEYNSTRREAKQNVSREPSVPQELREAKENIDTLSSVVNSANMSPVLAKQGFTAFGGEVEKLVKGKDFLFDGRDKRQIRQSLSSPGLANLFYGAVEYNVPGLRTETDYLIQYWQDLGEDDLDSLSTWYSEITDKATTPVSEIPYVDNIKEIIRPIEFSTIQNKGEVSLIVDEGKIKAAVTARVRQQGLADSVIPSEIAVATRFARAKAQELSEELTGFLNARHNLNILTNRQTGPDYLDAYFDPQYGLDLIFPLNEDIVPK